MQVKTIIQSIGAALLLSGLSCASFAAEPVIVIHGGAGTITKESMTAEREKAVRETLTAALNAGYGVLTKDGSSLDAVTTAINILEDSPLFNAGKGAVFTNDGENSMDASIMDGATQRAGAIAGVKHVKNPVNLARAVMEKSVHVMLTGEGAEVFAKTQGIEMVDPKYFHTDERWKQLQDAKAKENVKPVAVLPASAYFGTVGAVALDKKGNLAAATSTGGMTNKRWDRVGDAPIIGAGTYANEGCAISATGWGEFYIRAVAAHDICARVKYKGDSLKMASDEVTLKVIPKLGGSGGVIALDGKGNIAMPFSTEGMYRGYVDSKGKVHVAIYKN